MGSSKKHREREHRHKHKHRSRSRSLSRSRDTERKRRKEEEKRKRKELENYPDIRIASSSVKQEPKDGAGSSMGVSAGGGDDLSLTIEETNKLRAKLGLKPLEIPDYSTSSQKKKDKPEDEDFHAPPVNLGELKKTEAMKEKLAAIREKRKINQKLGKIKTLGQSESDDDDSARAWVKRNRKVEEEKALADKRAKVLEEMDAEFGIGGLIDEEFKDTEKTYTSKDLDGLKVEHSQERFKEGKTVILTLKDQGILDDGDETLVNYNIIDDEKAAKNVENKKRRPDYQPLDEGNVNEFGMFQQSNVLQKYDEEIEGEKSSRFQLGSGGKYSALKDRQLERIREDLKAQGQSLQSGGLAVTSEYFTAEEMEAASFKKVKKKVRKIRKKPKMLKAEDLLPLGLDGTDHGARNTDRRIREREEDLPQIPGLGDFEAMNVEKPLVDDEEDVLGPDEDLSNVRVEEDEAGLELHLALNKTRKLKQMKDLSVPEQIAKKIRVEKTIEDSEEMEDAQNIILNDTSEFCRSLGDIPTYGLAGNRDEERDELLDFELELMHERKRREAEEEIQSGWAAVEIDDRPVNIQEEEPPVLEEEPALTSGLIGALTVAKKKGYLNPETKKNAVANKNTDLAAQNYSIEDKRYDDLDEKFRKRDRWGGGGMVSDFKEKDSYRPDVKLEYVDESGRNLSAKEAFKQLSYRFHGKGSGKKKTEKMMNKLREEQLMKQMSSTDTPLGTVAMLQEKQRQEKMPYLVLSGGGKTMTSLTK
ncbi:U4/U6.U5 tri-snRNP-associated protein 1-like isoform X2 [Lineus longissimus]|uniref:U4/U6.U5 tri-snRNP-associated protein 1-like isoform X2 n=1 Tax=Lineus longissimus TaxID=88925 RepID=UPI002B4D9A28